MQLLSKDIINHIIVKVHTVHRVMNCEGIFNVLFWLHRKSYPTFHRWQGFVCESSSLRRSCRIKGSSVSDSFTFKSEAATNRICHALPLSAVAAPNAKRKKKTCYRNMTREYSRLSGRGEIFCFCRCTLVHPTRWTFTQSLKDKFPQQSKVGHKLITLSPQNTSGASRQNSVASFS